MKKKIISVVGARPNFIKIAPFQLELQKQANQIAHILVHTGQHFDNRMSKVFFEDLNIAMPNYNLGIQGGTHAEQTAKIMIAFDEILFTEKPDLIVVPGDVNSTLAAALTAVKLKIPVAHIESGLRSFDSSMPEEVNRVIVDHISKFLFVSENSGNQNLIREGVSEDKIHFVGNIMIDSLVANYHKVNLLNVSKKLGINAKEYAVATFHRPSNVDEAENLHKVISILNYISKYIKLIFPIHPRTKNNIKKYELESFMSSNILVIDPLSYFEFISLVKNSNFILTDSGGIQEETTYLKIPCITFRGNTERPATCEIGTNILAGTDQKNVINIIDQVLNKDIKKGQIPKFWDGKTASRICDILIQELIP